MREILFRGKRKDNGEWVEGIPITTHIGTFIVYEENPHYCDQYGYMEIDELSLVAPETVGQFTGMTDMNGKRIFEGDIVSFTRVNALGYTQHRIGEVRYYDELPVFYIMATTGDAWDWCDCSNIKVIANAHDNPELLEVKPWTI